jgi:hypothetical protein
MKTTLVIHPKDATTDFLKPIYENVPNTTVLTEGLKSDVIKLIKEHDRVFMMGHGSPWGLFGMSRFREGIYYPNYIIDNETVHTLLPKKENLFIWCNADQFVKRHELKGLYSGMFISEVGEASYCGLPGTSQETVNESNDSFADMLGKVMDKPLYKAYRDIKQQYKILAESNPVAKYNHERLYLN